MSSIWSSKPILTLRLTAALMTCVSLPVLAAAQHEDVDHGKEVYEECKGCHALNETIFGPKHCGVFGRRVGTVPDFSYSQVMKNSKFVWDEKHLDNFLKSPLSYLNGTNMGYAGLDSPQDRADLIAYLREAMNPGVCASQTPAGANANANGTQSNR